MLPHCRDIQKLELEDTDMHRDVNVNNTTHTMLDASKWCDASVIHVHAVQLSTINALIMIVTLEMEITPPVISTSQRNLQT